MDLRCPHRKFAELITSTRDEGVIEVTCPSRWCGRREGTVVRHTFSTRTGELLSTVLYREPVRRT